MKTFTEFTIDYDEIFECDNNSSYLSENSKLTKTNKCSEQYDNMHTRTVSEDFVKNMINELYGNKH